MKHGRKLFLLVLTGVMLLSLSISALAVDAYSDMTGSEWYAEAANQLREQGIMTGVGGNRFDANGTFTRAQLAQVLYNMGTEESAKCAELVGAKHNIPYHISTSNSGEMFDRKSAERWDAPNRLIVYPGEEIEIR